MSNNQPPSDKQALLGDLESIRDILLEPSDDETLLPAAQAESEPEPTPQQPDCELAPGVLPGQRNLFDGSVAGVDTETDTGNSATEEAPASIQQSQNPFLPPSKPATQRRSALFSAIQGANQQAPSPKPKETAPSGEQSTAAMIPPETAQQLIDQLVEQYMPQLEAELRQKLEALLKSDPSRK